MELIIRYSLNISIILLVVVGNLLLFRWLWGGVEGGVVVAPVQFIDSDGKLSPVSESMATLVKARLDALRKSTREAQRQLRGLDNAQNTFGQSQRLVSIDAAVVPETKLDLKVGGVELGGLLNWSRSLVAERKEIRLIVSFGPDNASVGGDVSALRLKESSIWLEGLSKNPARIADAIATSLYQSKLASDGLAQAGDLSREDFQTVITVLDKTADLVVRPHLFGTPESQFLEQFIAIQPIVARVERWPDLLRLAGNIAIRANREAEGIELLEIARKQYVAAKADQSAIDKINDQIAGLQVVPNLRKSVGTPLEALLPPHAAAIRKEVGSLSPEELRSLRNAFAAVGKGESALAGIYQTYSQHQNALYLPWSRAYLSAFETALQKVAKVTIPYWDFAEQPGIPAAFSDAQVAGGPNPLFAGLLPRGQGKTRRESLTLQSLPPIRAGVDRALLETDFVSFSRILENSVNIIHVEIGGDFAVVSHASYDPLFWALYANVDRLWNLWQKAHPGSIPSEFLERPLQPFQLKIEDVASTERLGYRYQ